MATSFNSLTTPPARRGFPYTPVIVVGLAALLLGAFLGYVFKSCDPAAAGGFVGSLNNLIMDGNALSLRTQVVAATLGTAAGLFLLSHALVLLGERSARKWAAPLLSVRQNGGPQLLMNPNIKDETLRERLRQQLREILSRTDHHFAVFEDFYEWYYSSIGTFSFAGLIAAITLFFISSYGWTNSPPSLLAVFVISTALAAFYRSFVSVYRQAENIADNKQLYKNYVALENALRTFCAVGESQVDGKVVTAADFVAHVDQKLAEFNNIAVGFDATKVESYEGLFDAVDKAKLRQQPAAPAPVAPRAGQAQSGGNGQQPPALTGAQTGADGAQGNGTGAKSDADALGDEPAPAADVQKPWDATQPELDGVYVAVAGDTLAIVSGKVGRTSEEIARNNPGLDLSGDIPAGTQLYIPAQEVEEAGD